MADPKQHKHEVRLQRPHGFYISDNELVDKLAAEIGIYAFGVYHMLMRRAENRADTSISLREIGTYLAINKNAVAHALTRLKSVGLIEELPSTVRSVAPTYVIVHAKDVVADRTSNTQFPQSRPSTGTRKAASLVPVEGHGLSLQRDSLSLHRDTLVPPEGHLIGSKQKLNKYKTTTPLPPSRGVEDHDEDLGEESTKAPKSEPAPSLTPSPKPSARPERPAQRDQEPVRKAGADEPFDLAGGLKRLGAKTSTGPGRTLAETRASFNGVLQDLHRALVDASLANVHKGKPGLRDGAEEFQRYFADVALEDYEAAEGTSEQIVLVVRTRDPAVTRKGFTIYRARIERSMMKYFGRVVQMRFEEA